MTGSHNPTAADFHNLSYLLRYHKEKDDIDLRNTGKLGKVQLLGQVLAP